MAEEFLTGVSWAVKRVTDEHSTADLEQVKKRELGAGSYVFGLVIEGAFIPLLERKGGGVDKKIAAARAQAAAKAAKASEQPQNQA